ncbi:MAG: multiheme c-type cytochrome [Planctomycetaceae bacterium]
MMDQPQKNQFHPGLLCVGLGFALLGFLLLRAASDSMSRTPEVTQDEIDPPTSAVSNPEQILNSADTPPESVLPIAESASVDVDVPSEPSGIPDPVADVDLTTTGTVDPEPASADSGTEPLAQTEPTADGIEIPQPRLVALNVSATSQTNASTTPNTGKTMPWKDWPKPQAALILTGEQHGYFEPCGCTANQLGGMSRRADLVHKLEQAGWSVRGLDVGGLSRRHTRQSQIKFDTTLAALRKLKYIAIGLGPEELRLKPDFLLTQHINEGDTPLAFLSANLEFYGIPIPDLGTPLASVIVSHEGLKIGVTSVFSEELKKRVFPFPDVTWKPLVPELNKVMATFKAQNVDLRVLLSQGTVEESKALAAQFPELDLVLTAEGVGDPNPQDPPKKVGRTLIIETGRKGKYVGVLGVYPDDAENRLRYQLVELQRDDFDETPSMIALMANYQERLKDEKVIITDAVTSPHPSGATFVGADKCGECHTTAYKIWKDTPHAHALESLDPVHQRTGHERLNGISRMHDPECLSCHVTGWEPQEYFRYPSGFLNEGLASTDDEMTLHKLLAGSQCENCHGPGSHHLELVDSGADDPGKVMRVTLEQARKGTCEKCHDADNSPKFEFDAYWDKVKHEGLD